MKKLLLTIAIAATTFGALDPAMAADGKTFPATICQRHTDAENAPGRSRVVSQFGRIINRHPSLNLRVVCPLPRDSMRRGIERVKVWGLHRGCLSVAQGELCPGVNRCVFRVMDMRAEVPREQLIRNLERIDESGGAAAILAANFPPISVPSFTSAAGFGNTGSIFVLFCDLAPGAELTSIYLGEGTEP